MKVFFKGVAFGLALLALHKLCCFLCVDFVDTTTAMTISGILFCLTAVGFLTSSGIISLLACGFTGMFFLFVGEITFAVSSIATVLDNNLYMPIYIIGFFGCMVGLCVAVFLTAKGIKPLDLFRYEATSAQSVALHKSERYQLLLFTILSAGSFTYFVLPQNAGVSVPIFVLLQIVCLWFLTTNKKRLLMCIPLLLLAGNCFWSANTIWRLSNLILGFLLYACMFTDFSFKNNDHSLMMELTKRIFAPFRSFGVPFALAFEESSKSAAILKKVLLGLLLALPFVIVLLLLLSHADMVFAHQTGTFLTKLQTYVSRNVFIKIACGLIAGLYLFGVLYQRNSKFSPTTVRTTDFILDHIVLVVFMSLVLVIYTLFVIVQFKYLFAGAVLPDGLTYTEYARKGFFELLSLTGVNILLILSVCKLTKTTRLTKMLCHYLCVVTVILLISSFYRMLLYTNDDGLTRMRLYVLGFLVFESFGLLATFFYIEKQSFRIVSIYLCIALVYYLLLNIVPTDRIIAENQVQKYLCGERDGIDYVFTLSADAAPVIANLLDQTDDAVLQNRAAEFLQQCTASDIPNRWQRYNLSIAQAKKLLQTK